MSHPAPDNMTSIFATSVSNNNIEAPRIRPVKGAALIGTGGLHFSIEKTVVAARLVDMIAEVVIAHQFHNTSSTAIEARFISPFDDNGFSYFITHS